LKFCRDDKLDELQTFEFTLPEDIERMKNERRKGKDVYQGLHTRFKSTGLRPDMEYIFCVKATYDDGSFLWSESKAFQTRA